MQESTLNKIRRVLNLGESAAEAATQESIFHYHDDMFHKKPEPGNQIHTKLHDPIHGVLRKHAAQRYFNLSGKRVTSRHTGEVYPVPEMKNESTSTNAKEAAKHRAKAEEFRNMPASRFNQFGDRAGRVRERYIAHHSERAHHYEKLAAGLGESTEESPEYHSSEYHHRTCLAMDHANAGRTAWAGIHQKAAERHAAAYHALTGKRIVDPLYVGDSPHIGSIAEAKEEDEAKSASVFPKAHHWNNAKRVYGVPLSVPLHAIGGYGVDKAGNRVSKKELVQRHAFAAANAASKWTPEEKRAWVQAKIAKAVAAKKAREATSEAISTSWENRGKFQVYAGTSTNCEPVGRAHLSHDEAWGYAKQVKASPGSKHRSSPLFIHDSGTGAIHGMSGRILGYTKI